MKTAKKSTPKPKKTPVTKKPKSSKGGPRNIDWYEVRKAYLTDNNLTYEDLAKTYRVSKTTIGNKALAENWTQLRQDLNEQAFSDFTQKLLDTKSEAQSRHLQHWQNLQALVNKAIIDIAERNYFTNKAGHLVLDSKNNPIPRPINPFELEKLAKAAKIAIDGERVVLGIPTSVSALSDPQGNNVWSGFSDMIKAAEKVLSENGQDSSGGNS